MHTFSEKLVHFLITKRIAVIISVLLSLGLFGYFCTKIYVDNDAMKSVPDSLKEKIELRELQKTFSSPFVLLFMAEFEKGTLKEKIDSISSWANRFQSIRVDSAKAIPNTVHLGRVKTPKKGGFFGIQSGYLIPKKKSASDELIRKRVTGSGDLIKGLISRDETILGMVLYINPKVPRPLVIDAVYSITRELDAYPDVTIYLTGEASMSYFISREMKKDFSILLPLGLLIASLLLFFIFRNLRYVIASLSVITVALIWTFGIFGMSGTPFSVVISIIPIIMFPVGVANSIHVLKTYSRHRWLIGKDIYTSLTETYAELLRPILLTSITTFIGFSSFVLSEISWTRHFGIFTGIGVMISLFFTVLLLPIFVYYEKKPKKIGVSSKDDLTIPNNFLIRFKRVIFQTPFCKFMIAVILIIFAVGLFFVRFESNPISMFSAKSTIRKSDNLIARYFGGTRFFYIIMKHKKAEINKPLHWAQIDSVVRLVASDTAIGDVSSLIPLVNKTSQILNNESISGPALSLLLKSKGLFGKSFKNLVNSWVTPDRRAAKLTITCRNIPGFKYTVLADNLKKEIMEKYPDWDVSVAGHALLIDAMIMLLIRTQFSSILLAFFSVIIVLALIFRSLKTGLFATLPMILSTMTVYALMGLFNVPINMVTVVIVNTCIGIGIDYSIHFTSGYIFIRKDFHDNLDALISTVKNKGTVIMFNTLVVGAGFFVLIFSSFPPIRSFGLFVFISMVVSSTFALIFLPYFFRKYI